MNEYDSLKQASDPHPFSPKTLHSDIEDLRNLIQMEWNPLTRLLCFRLLARMEACLR